MKNKALVGILMVFISLFIQCKKDNISENPTGFKFPAIDYVDAQVYDEMKKTCTNYWDLSKMTDSTLVIISYIEGYEIHCYGQTEGQDFSFTIITDEQGKWISDHKIATAIERKIYFNPSKIDQLKLTNTRSFWEAGLKIDTFDYNSFRYDLGYQDGEVLSNKKYQGITISVFQTKLDAVRAMEIKRNTVAAIFIRGSKDIINENWWYLEVMPSMVVVNKLNTILEVQSHSDFDIVKDTLYNTAREITRRIEVLSE